MNDYFEATFGSDEPELILGSGKLMKEMSEKCGYPVTVDHNGDPILDDAMYTLAKEGIFPA